MSWTELIETESAKDYFKKIQEYVAERRKSTTVYPSKELEFAVFENTQLCDVKVCIVGQDPYPGCHKGVPHAHGMSFSVPNGVPIPASLRAILKEAKVESPSSGNLIGWARQGVFLLNSVLTVDSGRPKSHSNIGWQTFTNAVVKEISKQCDNVVFMLWGRDAQMFEDCIDFTRHLILKCAHPSPLARNAPNPFEGCGHFAKANEYLENHDKIAIDWNSMR